MDALHREKSIDKELIFQGIESALLSAAKKKLGANQNIVIEINRETGDITPSTASARSRTWATSAALPR